MLVETKTSGLGGYANFDPLGQSSWTGSSLTTIMDFCGHREQGKKQIAGTLDCGTWEGKQPRCAAPLLQLLQISH
jgi:hypothetical protein